jgi:hypothetical protein
MDMHSRKQLAAVVALRYWKATKKEKSVILSEFCSNTNYERKHAIKVLKKAVISLPGKSKEKQKRNKPSKYMLIKSTIKKLWETADYPSGTRLKALLPELVNKGIYYQEIRPTGEQNILLEAISTASIDRMLQSEIRARIRKHNVQTTSGKLKYDIPLAIDSEAVTVPGTLEIDLVSHSGSSAMGEFINTLNSTDIITGWYEAEAIMGKSQKAVDEAIRRIEERLPFTLKGIDSDNGTEFINGTLKRFAESRKITFTRSRPYKKNDNAHIEQKNFTHVRKIIGYARFDTKEQQDLLNDLYRNELRLFINYFQPSQKLIKKERIGSKIKRVYDIPKTPYQRVLENKDIPEEVKQKLREQYNTLNPFALKRSIDQKLKKIMATIMESA